MELLPDKATFTPVERVQGDVPAPGRVSVLRLGQPVLVQDVDARFDLGELPEGGYCVTWVAADGTRAASTAIEVLRNPWSRLRYGFVADFSDDIDVEAHARWARRLHLSAVQFYDWAWRHEFLVGDSTLYGDPLGRQVSIASVKALLTAYERAGAISCGYAAVYAVDADGWTRWQHIGLHHADGKPFTLGDDFLWTVDPSDPEWMRHFCHQLQAAATLGFPAFHLDQYGWPKLGERPDGTVVDLAEAFPALLRSIADALPESRWIFNNVNDFPTEATAAAPQDATYIEVWDPHSEYGDLAQLVAKARAAAPARPVVLSAYLTPFAGEDLPSAEAALALAFAAIVSGGASHLIAGGEGRVLHDPYYVRNALASPSTRQLLTRLFDHQVALGDLLFAPDRVDVTRTWVFGVNEEVRISSEVPVSHRADAGAIWVRAFHSSQGLTLHCINLLDQGDAVWDAPKRSVESTATVRVRIQRQGFGTQALVARAEAGAAHEHLVGSGTDDAIEFELLVRGAWTVLHLPSAR